VDRLRVFVQAQGYNFIDKMSPLLKQRAAQLCDQAYVELELLVVSDYAHVLEMVRIDRHASNLIIAEGFIMRSVTHKNTLFEGGAKEICYYSPNNSADLLAVFERGLPAFIKKFLIVKKEKA
jgi:hypothetical protein